MKNQYQIAVFARATVISSGISLNEFEATPHSGTNVAFDDGGPMQISFSSPIVSFSGYFTYSRRLTIVGLDQTGQEIVSARSRLDNNLETSPRTNGGPNELLSIGSAKGISRIVITGDEKGRSFVLDDLVVHLTPLKARVLLHDRGREIEIDERTPDFYNIVTGAEGLWSFASTASQLRLIVDTSDIDKIKRSERSVEILYDQPKTFRLGKAPNETKTIELDRLLVPLSGRHARATGADRFTTLFYGVRRYSSGPYTVGGAVLDPFLAVVNNAFDKK